MRAWRDEGTARMRKRAGQYVCASRDWTGVKAASTVHAMMLYAPCVMSRVMSCVISCVVITCVMSCVAHLHGQAEDDALQGAGDGLGRDGVVGHHDGDLQRGEGRQSRGPKGEGSKRAMGGR